MKKIALFLLFLLAIAVTTPLVLYFVFPGIALEAVMLVERHNSGLKKRKLYVGEHTIRYLEGGNGETIILLHGFAGNKDTWTRFAKSLTPDFHILAFDLPGYGESSALKQGPHNIADQAAFLNRITNVMKLGSFHLAGSSMGGAIAARYAADYQNKVSSLALINSAGIMADKKSDFTLRLEKGDNPIFIENTGDFDEMLSFLYKTQPKIPSGFKAWLVGQSKARRPFEKMAMQKIIEEKYSMIPDLKAIADHQIKTFIIWGNKDRVIHISTLEILAKELPGSQTAIIKDCGHLPMLERPDESAEHYSRFLKRM